MVGSGKSQAIYNILFGNFDKKGKKISDGIVDFSEPMIIPDYAIGKFKSKQTYYKI